VDAIGRSQNGRRIRTLVVLVSPHRIEMAPSDAPALWNSGMSKMLSATARLPAQWLYVSQALSSVVPCLRRTRTRPPLQEGRSPGPAASE
jgi:hypothetical protein